MALAALALGSRCLVVSSQGCSSFSQASWVVEHRAVLIRSQPSVKAASTALATLQSFRVM